MAEVALGPNTPVEAHVENRSHRHGMTRDSGHDGPREIEGLQGDVNAAERHLSTRIPITGSDDIQIETAGVESVTAFDHNRAFFRVDFIQRRAQGIGHRDAEDVRLSVVYRDN